LALVGLGSYLPTFVGSEATWMVTAAGVLSAGVELLLPPVSLEPPQAAKATASTPTPTALKTFDRIKSVLLELRKIATRIIK
jgi:hypothetical protein